MQPHKGTTMKKYKNPRIAFVPSDHLVKIITELSESSGKSKASIVSEIMDEAATVMDGQLKAYRQIAAAPAKAREAVQAYANEQIATIKQAVLDFAPPPRKRKSGRGAANTG